MTLTYLPSNLIWIGNLPVGTCADANIVTKFPVIEIMFACLTILAIATAYGKPSAPAPAAKPAVIPDDIVSIKVGTSKIKSLELAL